MKRLTVCFMAVLFCTVFLATAAGALTEDDAKQMVKKAVAYYQANGKDKAVAAFNDPKGDFMRGELFIFMLDMKGTMMAYPANLKMVGMDLLNLKDSHGKTFVREEIETAKKGSGWLEFHFTNPVTKKIQRKVSYIERLDDNYFVGAGVFK